MYSRGPIHIHEQKLEVQLEPIYNSSVLIQEYSLEDILGAMDNRDEWREGQ